MATPAQAAAATVGAGSLAAAGAYGITQAVNGNGEEQTTEEQESPADPEIPTPLTFAAQDLTSYTNKVINVVKEEHLIKLVKATDENDKWWEWAFGNKYSNKEGLTIEATFNELSDFAALKKACKTAYEKEKAYFNTDNFLKNVGAFCTSTREKLPTLEPRLTFYKTTEATTGYANGLLSVEGNKGKLIKIKVETADQGNYNDLWWDWAFKNGFDKANTVALFSTVTSGYSDQDQTTTALNQACNAAYKKLYFELTANSGALLRDTKKFCSINKEATELTLPEPATPTYISSKISQYNSANTLAKKNNNKNHLVDPDANENWWTWTFDKYYPKPTDTAEKNKLDSPFENVTTAYKSSGTDNSALNLACKTAYKKTDTSFPSQATAGKEKLIDLVKRFCTLNTTSVTLEAPTNP